jgi:hypothetical protein
VKNGIVKFDRHARGDIPRKPPLFPYKTCILLE